MGDGKSLAIFSRRDLTISWAGISGLAFLNSTTQHRIYIYQNGVEILTTLLAVLPTFPPSCLCSSSGWNVLGWKCISTDPIPTTPSDITRFAGFSLSDTLAPPVSRLRSPILYQEHTWVPLIACPARVWERKDLICILICPIHRQRSSYYVE